MNLTIMDLVAFIKRHIYYSLPPLFLSSYCTQKAVDESTAFLATEARPILFINPIMKNNTYGYTFSVGDTSNNLVMVIKQTIRLIITYTDPYIHK